MKGQKDIRFEFGSNWENYLSTVNKRTIRAAKRSLLRWIPFKDLKNKKFLDIGSGSGLFSLAACEWGGRNLFF